MTLRLTLNVSGEVEATLRDLAKLREVPVTEVIRQALTTEKYLDDAMRAGKTVFVRDGNEVHILVIKGLEVLPPLRIKRRWRRK